MSSNAASPGFPPFARYGHNVVVTWDSEDRSTDAYLHAAVLVSAEGVEFGAAAE